MKLIEKPVRRCCPVCHDHSKRWGFYLVTDKGYEQFNCVFHVLIHSRIDYQPSATTSVKK